MKDYYCRHYRDYYTETAAIDPEPFLGPFAAHLVSGDRVLDVGCGSGRDLLWLKRQGMRVTGFEGSPGLAGLARKHADCRVVEGDFISFDFAALAVDAVLMCGALVHVPHELLSSVLGNICRALHIDSQRRIAYLSLKEGDGRRMDHRGRMFYDWRPADLDPLLRDGGMTILDFRRGAAADGSGQPWLGYVLYCGGSGP